MIRENVLPDPPAPPAVAERAVICATTLASSMVFIDGTALNLILPALQADLGASGSELLWIVNAYAVLLAALLLLGGSLGDHFGRKRMYEIGIFLFAGASLACAASPSTSALIAWRALQGISAAIMIPGSLALISSTFGKERCGKAIGTWSALSVISTAFGPVVGGLMAQAGFWRGIFLINVPLAAAALLVLHRHVRECRREVDAAPMDLGGAVLGTLGLAGITYAAIEAASRGFSNARILLALVLGLISLLLFVVVETRSRAPLVPLGLFKVREFLCAALVTLLLYSGVNGMLFLFPLNLIQIQGYDAATAGLTQLPLMISLVALSRWAGQLADRIGPRLPLTFGCAIAGAGFLLLALPGITSGPRSYWTHYLLPLVILGIGLALSITPLSATVMSSVDAKHSGLASGMNSALSRLASVFAVAVLGAAALLIFRRDVETRSLAVALTEPERAAFLLELLKLGNAKLPGTMSTANQTVLADLIRSSFLYAFRIVAVIAAGLAWLGAALSFFLLDRRPRPTGIPVP